MSKSIHYTLVFYVPEEYLEKVKTAVFAAGAGKIGNYDSCSWEVKGEGQFRPLLGSQPFCGESEKLHKLSEYRVEMLCAGDVQEAVLAALKDSHPYEEPAYSFVQVLI